MTRLWSYRYGDQRAVVVKLTDAQALAHLERSDPKLTLIPLDPTTKGNRS